MATFKTKARVGAGGAITIEGLAIPPGVEVEITVTPIGVLRTQASVPVAGVRESMIRDRTEPAERGEAWDILRDSA